MNLGKALDDFLLALAADGRSQKTVDWYASVLGAFVDEREQCQLTDIDARQVREYIVALRSRSQKYVGASQRPQEEGPLSPETIRGHVTALHSFWNWCEREWGIISPMRNIRRPPVPKRKPRAIDPADFVKLFNATMDTPAGVRDRAMLVMFADSGVRLGGLVSLRLEWLNLPEQWAQVVEKGSKAHKVHFGPYTVALMSQWLTVRESQSEFVFVSIATGEPITASGVHQVLKRLKRRAGVTGRVNPHSFRHRFALEYRKQGGDISTLAIFMGNSIGVAFDYYSVFSDDELRQLRAAHDPLATLIDEAKE